ncbi:DNA repair RAD52-like protein 2, chloroplastic [Chenopodium quinoa]|uniref:DNA repair RAD52-like protein 2, chloroplastic n=1 Tax=Chenopodium quinoa TaxID=63459 RepID=UPI000B777123|nr:DNA repair RAD52-like protein 2, chloroplastic [Chenopodium quinoa]XP_021722978.1 DNA repair RAD52-like protein 2, chloroplastic [Chenopodium quinoa]
MALRNASLFPKSASTDNRFQVKLRSPCSFSSPVKVGYKKRLIVAALDNKSNVGGGDAKKGAVPNSNYVVPLDKSASCITRPLAEILRDLNKRIPDNILKPNSKIIPWYHANRMLSFYAPGWCGEVRDAIFSDDGSVTVVYRVTIRGSDGEAYREATGTILSNDPNAADPVAAAEEIAFVRACARFGLGLYLYHE